MSDFAKNISPDQQKFVEQIITEVVRVLITNPGNERTNDAIWDLEDVFGVDISKVLNKIRTK